jgi:putative flippase GtrA
MTEAPESPSAAAARSATEQIASPLPARRSKSAKFFRHSSLRYGLVGLSNTAIGFAAIWFALRILELGNVAANITGYSIAFLWSFVLNRKWTFGHRGAIGWGLARYSLACLVAYVANLLVVVSIEPYLSAGSIVVQLGGMVTYTVLSYIGVRYFAFHTP